MNIEWLGASKKDFLSFPAVVQERFEYQFARIEEGMRPTDGKALSEVGQGVMEIRVKGERGAYRVIYVAKVKGEMVVLAAFRKQRDNEHAAKALAKKRLKEYRQRE